MLQWNQLAGLVRLGDGGGPSSRRGSRGEIWKGPQNVTLWGNTRFSFRHILGACWVTSGIWKCSICWSTFAGRLIAPSFCHLGYARTLIRVYCAFGIPGLSREDVSPSAWLCSTRHASKPSLDNTDVPEFPILFVSLMSLDHFDIGKDSSHFLSRNVVYVCRNLMQ